ncbi:MAG: TonB-dependent receptor [Bacteroidales bacterium]|nr:TonB-dependent receptor [Bacteroidales bacterium]
MVKHTYISVRSFRFRRFCRAAYAAFCSMHREVSIGRVATYIADRQLSKSVAVATLSLPLLLANTAMAQSDDDLEGLTLPVVTITAAGDTAAASEGAAAVFTHQDIQHLTASTVGELLEALPGVELRTRGVGDMQGDIVMRGGTFDQVVVLLNGVNISDAHTGHYNLDIPINLAEVNRIEVLPASALVRYGVSSFCGGINIVTGQTSHDRLDVSLSGGSHGTMSCSAGGDKQLGAWTLSAQGSYNRSDGYRVNTDYRNANLFLQAQRRDAHGAWQMQLGGQTKDFGSQDFYSLSYPDQFESTRTLLAAIQRQQQIGRWQCDMALYGRLHRDRFELFREGRIDPPAWYGGHNYHLASSSGLRLRAARLWSLGRTTLGAEYRREGIISSVLGDSLSRSISVWGEDDSIFYTLGKVRHRGIAFVEHSVVLSQFHLSGSMLVHDNSMSGFGYGYALSAEWRPEDNCSLTASVGRSDRQPTFTDLYYHSATQISDPSLQAEVSHTAELSARYQWGHLSAHADVYVRKGSNIIDWIRQPTETVWYSVNHAEVNALGSDARLVYRSNSWLRQADLSYSYCILQQEADGYVSKYALDYLRHQMSVSIAVSPWRNWLVKSSLSYNYRIGGYTDLDGLILPYDPVVLWNASLGYGWQQFTVSLNGYNLLNRSYMDYGGIPQPGATFMASLRYSISAE